MEDNNSLLHTVYWLLTCLIILPIDLITAPNSLVDTVPSPSFIRIQIITMKGNVNKKS